MSIEEKNSSKHQKELPKWLHALKGMKDKDADRQKK